MPDYSKGKIYKIECNITGEVYYGSTTKHYLSVRIASHKYYTTCVSRLIIERGNYNYKVIEYYPCDNKTELLTRERWWIENNVCINKQLPLRTRAEYREDNKHNLSIISKDYREKNKEIIKSKQKEKFTCECGGKYIRKNKHQHIKSKKHQDFISSHTDTH